HGIDARLLRRLPAFDMLGHAFYHNNRVVHYDADRQDYGEQGEQIDAETHQCHRGEGTDNGHWHRSCRHKRGAPVLQENDDDYEHECARLEKRAINLTDRLMHEGGSVERNLIDQPCRKSWSKAVKKLPRTFRRIERVRS